MVRGAAGGIASLRGILAEHEDLEPDLWDLYRVDVADVFTGRRSVRYLLRYAERLLDEPMSRYRAKIIGRDDWREHLGWGKGEYLTAALIDAVHWNTSITAAHGGKRRPRKPDPFARPAVSAGPVARSLDAVPFEHIEQLVNG